MRNQKRFVCLVVISTLVANVGLATVFAEDWPQWRGPNRDGVWPETGIVESFSAAELDIVWRAEIGRGYSGPIVSDGRVYVMDRLTKTQMSERVLCFDAKNGRQLWSHTYDCVYRNISYPSGPRASVTLADGRAFALGTMGHLHCLDAATGRVLWMKDLGMEYQIRMPIWGIASAPLVEGGMVIVQIGGSNNACLVAFNAKTGEERWRALEDRASYSAPIIIEQASQRVLVCYTGDNVVGLDPASGKVHWKQPFPPKDFVQGIATPVFHNDMLFITSYFDGALLLKVRQDRLAVEKVWRRVGHGNETDAVQCVMSTPYLHGQHIYGIDGHGELRCLDLHTGDRIWENREAVPYAYNATVHFIRNSDRVFLFNEMGELIIAQLSPSGYREISRAKLIEPTRDQYPARRGGVVWSHPAFADRHVYARNGKELVCANLAAR
ncbi:MAG: PQQ-like beta-propeller repeat protein [Phycisphaerales bacterium]|nr:MAG: PQQ-like beta-propeller repeat protein [Phycisphaerales bacterium]